MVCCELRSGGCGSRCGERTPERHSSSGEGIAMNAEGDREVEEG